MHNVKHHTERATEDQVIDLVFTACRANEARLDRTLNGGYRVTFHPAGENHLALVYNNAGQCVGSAVVDSMDC